MSGPEVAVFQRMVETRTFLRGAKAHTDGLAGYVRDFLAEHGGLSNEHGREWTIELCAELLKIPGPTLRRWVDSDQQKPPPYTKDRERARVRNSTTRSVLASPDERRKAFKGLPADVRDDVKADLMEFDGATNQCRHCRQHCPGKGD